jgi:hypothetical protein
MRSIAGAAVLLVVAATSAVMASINSQVPLAPAAAFAGVLDEHPAIQYAHRPARDRVSDLNRALVQGAVSLDFHESGGYLRAVLDALTVPAESQLLVFSRTGIQRGATSPRNPRAIYFDDSVVVGYIPHARWLEIAAHDPEQGVVFYTLEQTASATPRLTRRAECLTCHVASSTLDVPGMIVRSNFMSAAGDLIPQLGFHVVNHRTPLPNRWGGWYVTGTYSAPVYGGVGHMGNVTTAIHPAFGPSTTSNEVFIEWLNSHPEARGYPSGDSDVAALLVFDHQMHAINLLTRLNWETRVAMSRGTPTFTASPLHDLVDELVDYFLFVGEAPPPPGLTPRAGFAERLAAKTPKDRHGRSLGQLTSSAATETATPRLLRYSCSYMLYTVAFDNLPAPARTAVYERMWAILAGRDGHAKYSHLSPANRRAIIEILRDTKKDLPDIYHREVP